MPNTNADRFMERRAAEDEQRRLDARAALALVFGGEWHRLPLTHQALIVRDCTEDDGVTDYVEYRRTIGPGNLHAYAETQRARFGRG